MNKQGKGKIEWCDSTWNPITGCLHSCEYCYARKIAGRFSGHWNENLLRHFGGDGGMHVIERPMYKHTKGKNRDIPVKEIQAPYPYDFDPTFHRYRLDEPARKTKGQNIFVCSMADLFGDWVPDEWIKQVWEACTKADWHNYLFLTKNPKKYDVIYRNSLDYRNYMWFGTTATDSRSFAFKGQDLFNSTGRIDYKRANRFISIEPLHEELNKKMLENNIRHLDWVIIGAETGNRKGKIIPKKEWIDSIVEECKYVNIPVFMKDSLIPIVGEENMLREFPEELKNKTK